MIRQAYADNGIESVAADIPDQITGIAITYTLTSTTLTCLRQIHDVINLFFPNDEHIPPTYVPASTGWSEESRNIPPYGFE